MYLKVMSGEDIPDGDSRKTFTIHADVLTAKFDRAVLPADVKKPENRLIANQAPRVVVFFKNGPGETFWPEGNCYLMNDDGETIAQFGVHPYVKPRERN
jgi:hypothetical protein